MKWLEHYTCEIKVLCLDIVFLVQATFFPGKSKGLAACNRIH